MFDRLFLCRIWIARESAAVFGGLGILAGDHCKAASGLGLPFVAVGLMYRQGYFRQRIERDGAQQALFQPHALRDLPIRPVLDSDGAALQVTIALPKREVAVRVWRAEVGHLSLYLLDTDTPDNANEDRSITFQWYGGDRRCRIEQELVLGIGGVRALRALGLALAV